jgi:chemotaxis protein MotA
VLSNPSEHQLAASQPALFKPVSQLRTSGIGERPALDVFLLTGIAIAFTATILGLHAAGVSFNYFLQPVAAMIVLGGTAGIMLVTTPRHSLVESLRAVLGLLSAAENNRSALIDEIVDYARRARKTGGILALEPAIQKASHPLLRHALELAIDIPNHAELRSVFETELHMAERQGDADAKTLEVAGGFAPTLGIIGTVIGLIQVLRQFSNLPAVGYGIGTAFVSTIYGLALANLFLLPVAQRIRARVADNFETRELIMEGVLAIAESGHPAVIRMRLISFLRNPVSEYDSTKT